MSTIVRLIMAGAIPDKGLQLAKLVWPSLAPAIINRTFLLMRFFRIAGLCDQAAMPLRGIGAKPKE